MFLGDDPDHPKKSHDCRRDARGWNFGGYGAEYPPVGICHSAGHVHDTSRIWCTAGLCCCTAGVCRGTGVFCASGMQSIVVRGWLPPHGRSLLVQSGSCHERRLLIGSDSFSELIESHCFNSTARNTTLGAFTFSVILVSSRGLSARGDGCGSQYKTRAGSRPIS